jgi:hypothetical protein
VVEGEGRTKVEVEVEAVDGPGVMPLAREGEGRDEREGDATPELVVAELDST